jgi:hypothetical protein
MQPTIDLDAINSTLRYPIELADGHRLDYLTPEQQSALDVNALGINPTWRRVDEHIREELGLDPLHPEFKYWLNLLLDRIMATPPPPLSPEPLPTRPRLPSLAQLELGEDLAREVPALPFHEFPTVSALASSESSPGQSTPPSWSPINERSAEETLVERLLDEDNHPGAPWEKYNPCIHPRYIMIPAGPEGERIFDTAKYIRFAIHPLTGEPEILGTNGHGQGVHSEPLQALPSPGPAVVDDTVFTHFEEPQVSGGLDYALARLNDPGIRAEVIRLQQESERRRALMKDYDNILDLERTVHQRRRKWHDDADALQDRTMGARICLTNARVNSRLHPYLRDNAPAERLHGGHYTENSGEDGCTSEDPDQEPRLRCRFCLWTHKSKDCDTPHYLCSRRSQGRCMVSKRHDGYWNQMPDTCPFKGRNKKKTQVKKPGLYMRAEVD